MICIGVQWVQYNPTYRAEGSTGSVRRGIRGESNGFVYTSKDSHQSFFDYALYTPGRIAFATPSSSNALITGKTTRRIFQFLSDAWRIYHVDRERKPGDIRP